MPFSTPATAEQMRQFKSAAKGLSGRKAGEAMVNAILNFYRAEITVMDRYGIGELFRVGTGDPKHGVHGIHIHPTGFHGPTWQTVAHKNAGPLMTDENFNKYVGLLLQGLETGCYRAGFKHR